MCQKFIKGLAKYSNEMTKRGILTNSDFTKITNLAKFIYGLANLKQDNKRGMLIIVGFTKPANLAGIETIRQQNRSIDSWQFSQKWQI